MCSCLLYIMFFNRFTFICDSNRNCELPSYCTDCDIVRLHFHQDKVDDMHMFSALEPAGATTRCDVHSRYDAATTSPSFPDCFHLVPAVSRLLWLHFAVGLGALGPWARPKKNPRLAPQQSSIPSNEAATQRTMQLDVAR